VPSPKREPVEVLAGALPKEADPSIRLVWVDTMEILVRSNLPIATLRFYSALGTEKLTEACRLQVGVEHLRRIADVICRSIDYYPTKPDREK